jgi:hypothetical protein
MSAAIRARKSWLRVRWIPVDPDPDPDPEFGYDFPYWLKRTCGASALRAALVGGTLRWQTHRVCVRGARHGTACGACQVMASVSVAGHP